MKKLAGVTVALAGFVLVAIAATALATSSVGVTSTTLAQGGVRDIDVRVKTDAWKLQIDTKGSFDPRSLRRTRLPRVGTSVGTAIQGRAS